MADVLVTEAIIRLIAKYCGLELDEVMAYYRSYNVMQYNHSVMLQL